MSPGGRRDSLQGRYCFLCCFVQQTNVKILIGQLMNYLIHPSDWSATCHSKPLQSFIFKKADNKSRGRFKLIHHMLADVSNNVSFQN